MKISDGSVDITRKIKKDVTLANFTTFKVGGPCDYFIEIESEMDFRNSLIWAIKNNIPYFVLGRGANVLVSDNGYKGLIIYTGKFNSIKLEDGFISAECGALIDDLVDYAKERGFKGLEFLAGMPGTIGGAVYMNARAYGGEISKIIEDAKVLFVYKNKGELVEKVIQKEEMKFSYKKSIFQDGGVYLLKARFNVQNGELNEIRNTVSRIRHLRREKGEFLFPSAGCIFKNDYSLGKSTGKIIDECGLKGLSVGNAVVYDKHANFIVNKGGATATEIYRLIKMVEREVYEKTGVKLMKEIVLVGFDEEFDEK